MAKAKRKNVFSSSQASSLQTESSHLRTFAEDFPPPPKRRASRRLQSAEQAPAVSMNPDQNADILDGAEALRASPDAEEKDEMLDFNKLGIDASKQVKEEDDEVPSLVTGDSDSSLSEVSDIESPIKRTATKTSRQAAKVKPENDNARSTMKKAVASKIKKEVMKEQQFLDPEADGEEEADEEEIQAALSRPPPVNSDYLPIPWKGRIGYACLCTYLRFSNPPVFSSRTCRIASILENRHPLKNPDQPPHATKNRPDREQPASNARGQAYVESLGLANARDVVKMLRWNERYNIKFMRLSSEMFPFASHPEYGYTLAPFASEVLAEVGKVATELGHRLTTHPGQFTQLGSPRKPVIENAFRDLDYHAELLSLLKLPPQEDRDAVMILHLGGVFGDKAATLDRFRENYAKLPQGVKNRLVLENDDVSWSVHELLPLCEELNIPMVLDFHHHNIIFDPGQIREGTKDIVDLFPRILATWKRKNIRPKMHYSEPRPAAVTCSQRRKHNPRVATLPPCPPDMDLMIEAKDKEQAVFELMKTFKLPGYDTFNDIIPHVRKDDNKPVVRPKKKTPRKKAKKAKKDDDALEAAEEAIEAEEVEEEFIQEVIPEDDIGMGGPEGRVYWPPGMEDWLRPVKRVVKKKDPAEKEKLTPAKKRKAAEDAAASAVKLENEVQDEEGVAAIPTPTATKKIKTAPKSAGKKAPPVTKSKKDVPEPEISEDEEVSDALLELSDTDLENSKPLKAKGEPVKVIGNGNGKGKAKAKAAPARQSARAKKVSYAEAEAEAEEEGE